MLARKCRTAEDSICKRGNASNRFVVVNGLRYGLPEERETVTHIKEQYAGHTLSTTLAKMWRLHKGAQPLDEAEAYWRTEIMSDRVMICHRRRNKLDPIPLWKRANPATVIQRGDKVKIMRHHHERVIVHSRPKPLTKSLTSPSNSAQYFVFDKPAGVTCSEDPDAVNSLRALASEEIGQRLHLAHRLDQCVTGCVILASSAKAASRARKLMNPTTDHASSSNVEKYYIARVRGILPNGLRSQTKNLLWKGLCCNLNVRRESKTTVHDLWRDLDCCPTIKVQSTLQRC